MDLPKLLISTAIRQAKKSALPSLNIPVLDTFLGAAVRSIDVDAFEDEYDKGRVIDVSAVEVKDLDQRIELLANMTKSAALSMPIRQKAVEITSHCRAEDKACLAQAVFDFAQSAAQFREEYQEQFFDPRLYVRQKDRLTVADCDDYTSLISSLLLASGVGVGEEKIIWRITGQAGQASHIYPLAPVGNGQYLALDATLDEPIGTDISQTKHQLIADYPLI
jgi:hypothetical protein